MSDDELPGIDCINGTIEIARQLEQPFIDAMLKAVDETSEVGDGLVIVVKPIEMQE